MFCLRVFFVFPQRWIAYDICDVHIIFLLIFEYLFVFPFKEKLIFLDEFQVPSSSCKKAVESAPWHEELKWHGRSRWKQCENWFLGWKNGFKLVEIDTEVVISDFDERLYLNKRDLWFQENLTTNVYLHELSPLNNYRGQNLCSATIRTWGVFAFHFGKPSCDIAGQVGWPWSRESPRSAKILRFSKNQQDKNTYAARPWITDMTLKNHHFR